MFRTLVNAFKNKDIRKKIFITIGLLLIYRLGCWLPIPGITTEWYTSGGGDTFLDLLSAITGGALSNGAFLAIGISPYINSSIIVQLLSIAIPKLEEWSKQGDEGRKKLAVVTRVLTLILAVAQSVGIVVSMSSNGIATTIYGVNMPLWLASTFVAIILIAGSMFTMWLGERITDYGIGNGISLLIFVGILSSAGLAIIEIFRRIFAFDAESQVAVWELIGFIVMVVAVFAFIVFVDGAERRIPIQYAKQIKGRKQYGGQSTNIPIKINAAGVLPIIFATAIITFPQLICSIFAPNSAFYGWWMNWLGSGTPIYFVLTGLLILFFSYFYAQIQFNPEDVARNIQQYGGFIPGIRPGRSTSEYLSRISKRLTLFGAIFLAFIAIVPSIIFAIVLPTATLVNAFSATGLLIVVSVALEFDKQLESQLMMKQYKGFLK